MHVLVEIDWRADKRPRFLLSMRPLVLPRIFTLNKPS